jgi:release factor glutamine methyltransferase
MPGTSADSGPWTVARLLQWTQDYFRRHQLEDPRLCSELLLGHAMNCARIFLYTQHDQVPAQPVVDQFRAAVRAAAAGTPIAYIIGAKEFFSLEFHVNAHVLIPRPETEILVERAIRLCRDQHLANPRILDVGTGSGCIAIALAKHLPGARLAAGDCSPDALAVATANAERHAVADRIDFRPGDLLDPFADATFDLVVSNPPYVAERDRDQLASTVRDHEPAAALFAGPDGLNVIRRLIAATPNHLALGGHLLLEIGHDQRPAVTDLTRTPTWSDPTFYRDPAGIDRVLHLRRAADAGSQVA